MERPTRTERQISAACCAYAFDRNSKSYPRINHLERPFLVASFSSRLREKKKKEKDKKIKVKEFGFKGIVKFLIYF